MKKKIIFLVLLLLMTSGCEIEYTLDMDNDTYIEKTIATGNPEALSEQTVDLTSEVLYDIYKTKPIPIFNDVILQAESDEKIKDVTYYKTKDLSSNNQYGLQFTGKFNFKDIGKSSLINYVYNDFSISKKDNETTLSTGKKFKLFEQYPNLDKATINIKTKNKVIKNNADTIKNNTYTWYITKENYQNKPMTITIKQNQLNFKFKQTKVLIMAVVIMSIIAIVSIFIKYKRKKINKI